MHNEAAPAASVYIVALAATALAVLLRWATDPWLGEYLAFSPLLGAVAVAVWYGGVRPGLAAAAAGLLAYDVLFIEPPGAFKIGGADDIVAIGIYVVTCLVIIGFGEALHAARRRAEAGEEQLRSTLDSLGDAVIATDREGRVTTMNPAAESLTGWNHADAEGYRLDAVFRIVDEHTRQPAENPVHKAMTLGRSVDSAGPKVLLGRGGSERPIDDRAAPIRSKQGEIVGCVLVFRDITARRTVEAVRDEQTA
jgi:PAS domain S-box-containing protein